MPRRAPPHARFLASLALWLYAWACAALAQPVIRISDVRAVDTQARGVSTTFYAESEGRTWFFKRDGEVWLGRGESRMRLLAYGNFEAEILSANMLRSLGFRAPRCRVIRLEGTDRLFLQVEHLDQLVPPAERRAADALSSAEYRRLDRTAVRRLALVDLMIGNADRHQGNLFFRVPADGGPLELIPIDHNLAMATERVIPDTFGQRNLQPTFDGVDPARARVTGDQAELAANAGRADLILGANQFYDQVYWQAREDAGRAREFVEAARAVVDAFPDETLRRMIDEVPDAAISRGDPAARKRELFELLRQRRDLLEPFAVGVARQAGVVIRPRRGPMASDPAARPGDEPFGQGEGRTGSEPAPEPRPGPADSEPRLTAAEAEALTRSMEARARELLDAGRIVESGALYEVVEQLAAVRPGPDGVRLAEVQTRIESTLAGSGLSEGVRAEVRAEARRVVETRAEVRPPPVRDAPVRVRPGLP